MQQQPPFSADLPTRPMSAAKQSSSRDDTRGAPPPRPHSADARQRCGSLDSRQRGNGAVAAVL
eukprot:454393-Prymnesium_polylepis.1